MLEVPKDFRASSTSGVSKPAPLQAQQKPLVLAELEPVLLTIQKNKKKSLAVTLF